MNRTITKAPQLIVLLRELTTVYRAILNKHPYFSRFSQAIYIYFLSLESALCSQVEGGLLSAEKTEAVFSDEGLV